MTVFEGLAPKPSMLCNVRNSRAIGLFSIVAAASAKLTAASRSPSALVIVALFSRSAEA